MAADVDPAGRILAAFRASQGGDAGLVAAIRQLDPAPSEEDEAALVAAAQRVRGRASVDPLDLTLTPRSVVEVMRAAAARAGLLSDDATQVDPACGTGRLLAPRSTHSRVLAWDVDPVAVAIGQRLGRVPHDAQVRDALTATRPTSDAIAWWIAPPDPGAAALRSHAAWLDRDAVRRHSKGWAASDHPGIALLARVVRDLARPGETCVLWLPARWLTAERFAALRRQLAIHLDRAHVVLPGSPPAWRDARVIVVARRGHVDWRAGARALGEVSFADGDDPDAWSRTARTLSLDESWSDASPAEPWVPPVPALDEALTLLRRIGVRVGDRFDVFDGVNPGGRDARQALVGTSARRMSKPRPLVVAGDVSQGHVAPPSRFIETDPALVSDGFRRSGTSLRGSDAFDGPRLYVVRRGRRLVAAVVDDDSVPLNTVCVIRPRGRARNGELQALCGYLNSRVAAEHHAALFGSEVRRRHVALRVGDLRRLPLLWPLRGRTRAVAAEAGQGGPTGALDAALRDGIARLIERPEVS